MLQSANCTPHASYIGSDMGNPTYPRNTMKTSMWKQASCTDARGCVWVIGPLFFANTTSSSGAVLYRADYADCRKLPKSAPERIALTCTSSISAFLLQDHVWSCSWIKSWRWISGSYFTCQGAGRAHGDKPISQNLLDCFIWQVNHNWLREVLYQHPLKSSSVTTLDLWARNATTTLSTRLNIYVWLSAMRVCNGT